MSVFADQQKFMKACGQKPSHDLAKLYRKLMAEELAEMDAAMDAFFQEEVTRRQKVDAYIAMFDGVIDVLVTTIGFGIAMNFPMQAGWDEVTRSNLSKLIQMPCSVCEGTGSVRFADGGCDCANCSGTGKHLFAVKQADGKVIKAEGYFPPNLKRVLETA